MSKAVMQQAFDLLCDAVEPTATQIQADIGMCAQWDVDAIECIDTLRQALAQPEQESISTNDHLCAMLRQVHDVLACTALPMKREWVGLTDEERNEMIGRIQHDQYTRQRDLINSTQIITEMYLKEKNGG